VEEDMCGCGEKRVNFLDRNRVFRYARTTQE
jgi:hypothetical protein